MSVKPPCGHCGALYHSDYEDGLVECRDALAEQRDEWKDLAVALRNHESRIMGILADADNSIGSADAALDAIDFIVNGPRTTSAPTLEQIAKVRCPDCGLTGCAGDCRETPDRGNDHG